MTETNPGGRLPGPWLEDAACRGHDPELWHVELRGTRPARDPWARARAICLECPVMVQCREWALTVREPRGMYGGMDPSQRAAVLAREGVALRSGRIPGKCGTPAGAAAHRRRDEPACPACRAAESSARAKREYLRTP